MTANQGYLRRILACAWVLPGLMALQSLHAFFGVDPSVPGLLNYQGRVMVSGNPFTGTGQFKFALVNKTGTVTYWSNDNTSTAGSEPSTSEPVQVVNGLYSVQIGNSQPTHLTPNMTPLPASVFENNDVHLRIWFNNGVNGFQLITPDQRIASVGYSLMAAGVADATITSAKLVNGAVTGSKLADGAVVAGKIADGAVQSSNIAAGAVTSAHIAPGTVGFASLAKPLQSGTLSGLGLSYDFGRASFTVAFPLAFATPPVTTLSLSSASSAFPLEATVQVTATSGTQFSGRVNLLTPAPLTIDADGDVGSHSAMAVVAGNPAICYFDSTNKELQYVRASDTSGTSWGAPLILASTGGDTIANPSMVIINGRPTIGYAIFPNSRRLGLIQASDSTGTGWGGTVVVPNTGNVGDNASMTAVNGNPAFSYYDTTSLVLKYVRSSNSSGTSWLDPVIVDGTGNVGLYSSLTVINGNPAISYHDSTNRVLKYVRATDANGTAWGAPVVVDSNNLVGHFASLVVVNGNPAISYLDLGNFALKYVRANDADGAAWGTPLTLDNASFGDNSLAVINGKPAISYSFTGDLKYVRASDANGNAWGTPVTLDSIGAVGEFASMAVVNGQPAISYYDATKDDLKFVRQADAQFTNFNINWIALEP